MKSEELGRSLLAAYARVPDVRSRHGRRYELAAVLTLATAARLAGARSLYAIAQWGRLQPPAVRRALGFAEADMPAHTTLHYVFKRLEVPAFETVLAEWALAVLGPAPPGQASPEAAAAAEREQLVVDGKALRGLHGEELPGVRLVAVYAARAGLVLAQAGGQDPGGASRDQ
jgi:DDE_Tnp_1-associated